MWETGNLEEIWKRKREEIERNGEEEELLKRSKKGESLQKKGTGEGKEIVEEWMKVMENNFSGMMEEIRESFKSQERVLNDMIIEMRGEFKKQLDNWKEEKEELKRSIEKMRVRIKELEKGGSAGKGGDSNLEGGVGYEVAEQIRKLERRFEIGEKAEKKKNVIIKGVEVKEERKKEKVKRILDSIGAKVEIKEIRRIREGTERGSREMLIVKLGSEEQKWDIMGKKKILKGRRERIVEDLTWKERKIRWRVGEIARKEKATGRRVWVNGGRIRIEGKWWRWDEEDEVLKNEGGLVRGEEGNQGEGK